MLTLIHETRDDLHRQGIKTHDVIAVNGSTCLGTVATLLAAWSLGATTWLYSPRDPVALREKRAQMIGARMLSLTPKDPTSMGSIEGVEQCFHPSAKTILNTSGSTGHPKFVEHDLQQHFLSAVDVNKHMQFDSSQRWLMSLPLHHVGGLAILIRSLIARAPLIIPRDKETLREILTRQRVTHISLVAAQLKQLIAVPLTREKLAQCTRVVLGGGPLPTCFAHEDAMSIVSTYGSTEMASMWTCTNVDDLRSNPSSGKILGSREIRIQDDGEISVRGPMLFKKYRSYAGNDYLDVHGFFKTGDVGRIDDQGNLHILGRRDNMFISGGENIHPQEIEKSLLAHPSIDDAVVVSVPDTQWGERPVAFVKSSRARKISEGELKEFLQQSLPKFKIPDRFFDWPLDVRSPLKPSRIDIRQKALSLIGL